MKLTGTFKLEDNERVFETHDTKIRCTHCLNQIKNRDDAYVCEINKTIYCLCHKEKSSPVCKNSMYRKEHQDILVSIKILGG